MTTDNSKNISNIQYNILNLPERVQFSSGGTDSYMYDAAGVKRQVKHQGAETAKRLGETKNGKVARKDQGGTLYKMKNPISIEIENEIIIRSIR